jgi:SAM-dependent methyltransferase
MAQEIDYFSKRHPLRRIATAVALRAREKMFRRFEALVPFDDTTTVIDVGVTPDRELADSNFFERLFPHPHNLTATSIEDAAFLEALHPGLRFVRTDGTTLPFADGEFDVAFSSAVLEHVGDRAAQRRFVEELCRVSRRFYLTTPNRWFPIEVHTFLPLLHWLPQRWHQRTLCLLRKPFWAETSNLNLLSGDELTALFPADAEVRLVRHRTAGWCSNLIVHGRSSTIGTDRWVLGSRKALAGGLHRPSLSACSPNGHVVVAAETSIRRHPM